MTTKLQEILKDLTTEVDTRDRQPSSGGRSFLQSIRDGVKQGALHTVPSHVDSEDTGASLDLDRENTTRRDRLTPRVQIDIGTYTLVANTPLMISLPRWARQVIIQNNTDLAGTSAVITRSLDGTPATPGDFVVRQGQTVSDDVFSKYISLYSTSTNTINGKNNSGIVIEVSS